MGADRMTAERFVQKWTGVELSERAASQEHFIDLCRLIGQATPAEADPRGEDYCFEKSVQVVGAASRGSKGEGGFVDVWKRGCFAWEYKRKDKYKSLEEAYRQLYQYRDALDNPPLSIVCDIRTTEIRTHFASYPTEKIVIRLEDVPSRLEVLRRAFTSPESFRPFKSRAAVTTDAANEFGRLADSLIDRFTTGRNDPQAHAIAHFLMRVMFCLFAEDIELLPGNSFTRLVNRCLSDWDSFKGRAEKLFGLMRTGGEYGNELIPWFNGGLFDDAPAVALNHGDVIALQKVALLHWAGVEPSIFGTLFERILDPAKRAQIGAHYTSKDDILLVVEPVVMMPLRQRWQALQGDMAGPLAEYANERNGKKRAAKAKAIEAKLDEFRASLGKLRILDPACGSGNFLYVALQQLLDLDGAVVAFAARHGLALNSRPYVRPTQLHGIEINPYAAELAQVVIWIGYLQWLHERSIDVPRQPILDKLECIENRDAILDLSDPEHPAPAKWPDADFIIGNPPFLGSNLFRANGLSEEYVQAMYKAYDLPRASDLCCYWFEVGRREIERRPETRCGLLATQGIRGASNRVVLERIQKAGNIFMAWSDRGWVLDGAAVHVSIAGFDGGQEQARYIDGLPVATINTRLSATIDLTAAKRLSENSGVYVRSPEKGAKFEIPFDVAIDLLRAPNPNGRPSSDVLHPWINGEDLTKGRATYWIIDFHDCQSEAGAAGYEAAFRHTTETVKAFRQANRYQTLQDLWWKFRRPGDAVRRAAETMPRLLATTMVSKHRIFAWIPSTIQPDKTIPAFARCDDYFFGVLHSAIHELWARRMGTQLEDRPRYTPTTCFETFPLPWPPGKEDVNHPAYQRIAGAAKALDEQRERWLNPPEWIEPIAQRIDAEDDFADVPESARTLVRRSAIMAAAAKDARLKKRTLTNLYNQRPTWLRVAHEQLDRAVLGAYAAVDPAGEWSEDWAEVWVETGAGQALKPEHPLAGERQRVDQRVLGNLLRMNGQQEHVG